MTGYTDADGSTDRDERKSTSGYAFILGGGAISWCSKKKACVSLAMMELENVDCIAAVQEAISITTRANEAVVIYYDNTAVIAYAKDPK